MPTITPIPPTTTAPPPAPHGSRFWAVMSELNPLQYIPVVGTLYRAITGDTVPEKVREGGSLIVSALTGGPVGVATNAAMLVAEKVTGIDPERIAQRALADIGLGHTAPPSVVPVGTARLAAAPPAASPPAWSPAQLTAYGVTRTADGDMRRGNDIGSDVLNSLELARDAATRFA